MNEHTRSAESQQVDTDKRGIEAAGTIALRRMTRHYGTGFPDCAAGTEVSFAAHNGLHGKEVGRAAMLMATRLELPSLYVTLSRATGEAHDAILTDGKGNKLPRGEMEERTAAYFTELLRKQGADSNVVTAGRLGILGTTTTFSKEGYLIAQGVSSMEFPTPEAEGVAMSVSCADMAGAFGERAAINSLDYYKEFRGIQATEAAIFNPDELVEHCRFERQFLDNYAFPHSLGEELFGRRRGELNAFFQCTEDALLAGSIENWQGLVQRAECYDRR